MYVAAELQILSFGSGVQKIVNAYYKNIKDDAYMYKYRVLELTFSARKLLLLDRTSFKCQ